MACGGDDRTSAGPTTDPNLSYNFFIEILQSAKEKHLPSKLIRFKKYKHKKCT